MNSSDNRKMGTSHSSAGSGKVLMIFLGVALAGTLWAWYQPGGTLQGWREDLAAARDEARASGKPMLLYFTADWCGPCRQMKSSTWSDDRVKSALHGYVFVKVDVDAQPDVARRFNVDAIPRVVVLDHNENPVSTRVGYVDASSMAAWLTNE